MTENLIPIVFTRSECEMLINGLRSISNSIKRACPGIVNDPDFNMMVNIIVGIEKGLADSIREEGKKDD